MKNRKFTVGGLFSGVGGIELAFERAGFDISWANEFDKNACKTYRLNHPNHNLIEEDIYKLNPKKMKSVDVLVGGFPCQAFSVAGYRKGFKDPRGNLFYEIARFIDELKVKPKALMLENVKNLSGHDKGNTRKAIEKILIDFGYNVHWQVYNTYKYSDVPQNRERTIICCFKNKKTYLNFLNNPIKRISSLKSISSMLEKNKIDEKYYYFQDSQYYKMLKKEIKNPNTFYQLRRIYVRENKSNLCPTLTANMGTGGHNVPLLLDKDGIRKLTPKECFNFQGYNNIKFPRDVPNTQLYKQAGNSVTVPLIVSIAKNIKLALNES